jgi:hypothetical protein
VVDQTEAGGAKPVVLPAQGKIARLEPAVVAMEVDAHPAQQGGNPHIGLDEHHGLAGSASPQGQDQAGWDEGALHRQRSSCSGASTQMPDAQLVSPTRLCPRQV